MLQGSWLSFRGLSRVISNKRFFSSSIHRKCFCTLLSKEKTNSKSQVKTQGRSSSSSSNSQVKRRRSQLRLGLLQLGDGALSRTVVTRQRRRVAADLVVFVSLNTQIQHLLHVCGGGGSGKGVETWTWKQINTRNKQKTLQCGSN